MEYSTLSTNDLVNRDAAIQWARGVLAREDIVYLDTETTGLGDDDEIVTLGVLDTHGNPVASDMTVKPRKPIAEQAQERHGISNEMVAGCPDFGRDMHHLLQELCERHTLIIYNAEYDVRIIRQTCAAHNLPEFPIRAECAMLQYAAYCGEWNEYYGNYRWQKLPGTVHGAVADCKALLAVVRRMAASPLSTEPVET